MRFISGPSGEVGFPTLFAVFVEGVGWAQLGSSSRWSHGPPSWFSAVVCRGPSRDAPVAELFPTTSRSSYINYSCAKVMSRRISTLYMKSPAMPFK